MLFHFFFLGYKSVVAVHRRGVPNDIRRKKNFPFYILQYENDSLHLPMSWDSRALDSPAVRANHFYLLIFRIFEFWKKKERNISHTEFCVGDLVHGLTKPQPMCVCVCLQQDKEKVQSFGLFLAPGELKEIQKKTKTREGRWGSVKIDDDDTYVGRCFVFLFNK